MQYVKSATITDPVSGVQLQGLEYTDNTYIAPAKITIGVVVMPPGERPLTASEAQTLFAQMHQNLEA